MSPLTLALQRLANDNNDLVSIEVRRYMRDVLDHNIQVSDRIVSYDDMLSPRGQAALGKVAMQQNVDMRKISAWVAIAAVPTAVAGVYGMNFEHMPELKATWGYPAVLTLIVVICLTLHHIFRKNKWKRSRSSPVVLTGWDVDQGFCGCGGCGVLTTPAVAVGDAEEFEGPPLQWGGGGDLGECGHVVGGLNLVGAEGGQIGEQAGEAVHRGVILGAFTRGFG